MESEINLEDRVAEFHFVLVLQFLQGRVFPRKVPQGSLSFPKVKVIQEMLLIEGSAEELLAILGWRKKDHFLERLTSDPWALFSSRTKHIVGAFRQLCAPLPALLIRIPADCLPGPSVLDLLNALEPACLLLVSEAPLMGKHGILM